MVGESGSGKSVTALSVMRLLDPDASRVTGSVKLAGRELLTLSPIADALGSRPSDRHDLPGGDDQPQPAAEGRRPDRRGAAHPRHCLRPGGPQGGRAAARPRADARVGLAPQRLSAVPLRRHAPARDDRDGACVQAEAPDRRRADHGARRHHPGPDPAAHQAAAEGRGHGRAVHHPRHGRRRRSRGPHGRDARRPGGRDRDDRGRLRQRQEPLHPRADRGGPASWAREAPTGRSPFPSSIASRGPSSSAPNAPTPCATTARRCSRSAIS